QGRVRPPDDGDRDGRGLLAVPGRHPQDRRVRPRRHHPRPAGDLALQPEGRRMTAAGDELVFLPLGGSGEIGMNFNLYGFGPPDNRKWIVVDLGVTFGDQSTPGVEIILPDPVYIEAYA